MNELPDRYSVVIGGNRDVNGGTELWSTPEAGAQPDPRGRRREGA